MLLYVLWPRGLQPAPPRAATAVSRRAGARDERASRERLALARCVALLLPARLAARRLRRRRAEQRRRKPNTVAVKITDAGCEPAAARTCRPAPTTFKVANDGADSVTEFEVLDGDRILGEAENIAPGLSGDVLA